MPASKLARKTWSTATRLGLPIGFAVVSLHLGNNFSCCAAHSVQAVAALAASDGSDIPSPDQPPTQIPGRVVGGSRAAQGASVSVPACTLWNGLVGRCVRAVQGSLGGPGAGLGGPGPPRRWPLTVSVSLVAPLSAMLRLFCRPRGVRTVRGKNQRSRVSEFGCT